MADFLTTKRDEIQARLNELAPLIAEHERLQQALNALEGVGGAPTTTAASPTPTRRRATTRRARSPRKTTTRKAAPKAAATTTAAPKAAAKPAAKAPAKAAPKRRKAGRPRGSGQRSQQALELVRKEPGLSAADIARKIGVHPNYAYRILPNLADQGQVTKRNRKWYPKDAS